MVSTSTSTSTIIGAMMMISLITTFKEAGNEAS